MNTYRIRVSSDQGPVSFLVKSKTIISAIHHVMIAEKCPESAITSVKRVKSE
jgi:hypothetical protein